MSSLRAKLSACILIAGVISATGNVFAGQHEHASCPMERQDCEHVATITQCCHVNPSDASNHGGPVESRIRLSVDLSPLPVALVAVHAGVSRPNVGVHTSPPRVCPLDLPTLFAALLI